MARDEAAVKQLVEEMARTFADWGFPRMAARVLITMMASDEDSLSAVDLAERLEVSAPAISHALRYLVQLGIVERAPVPGSRRDLYRPADDAWYMSSTTKGGIYKTLADLANRNVEPLGGPHTPSGARMAQMGAFFDFVQSELGGLMDRWKESQRRQED